MRRTLTVVFIVTPSLAWGQICVSGRVVDAGTDRPVAGAAISAAWSELHNDRVQRTSQTTSDATGHYRLCLKRTSSALLSAAFGATIAYLPIVTPSTDSALGDLRLPVESDTGSATVTGRVVSDKGVPLAGAVVTILGGHVEIPTTSEGSFGLRAPAGSQVLVVRHVGLDAAVMPVDLSTATPRVLMVTLQRSPPTLAAVNVVATRMRLAPVYDAIGFTARQELGHGHFLTAEDIESRQDNETAELFRGIPGVKLRLDHNNVLHVYSDRGTGTLESYGDCTAYFVDGALIGNGRAVYATDAQFGTVSAPEDEEQLPPPSSLIAIEVYQPNEPAPVASGVVSRCLKVLLWTKAMIRGK
jgi:Carboxypeptidase regulatory-like domain